jgi:hypothetical protein
LTSVPSKGLSAPSAEIVPRPMPAINDAAESAEIETILVMFEMNILLESADDRISSAPVPESNRTLSMRRRELLDLGEIIFCERLGIAAKSRSLKTTSQT